MVVVTVQGAPMIVHIGKVGDRLAYLRIAQLKRVYRQRLFERYFLSRSGNEGLSSLRLGH